VTGDEFVVGTGSITTGVGSLAATGSLVAAGSELGGSDVGVDVRPGLGGGVVLTLGSAVLESAAAATSTPWDGACSAGCPKSGVGVGAGGAVGVGAVSTVVGTPRAVSAALVTSAIDAGSVTPDADATLAATGVTIQATAQMSIRIARASPWPAERDGSTPSELNSLKRSNPTLPNVSDSELAPPGRLWCAVILQH
jgi:hypothetical protein